MIRLLYLLAAERKRIPVVQAKILVEDLEEDQKLQTFCTSTKVYHRICQDVILHVESSNLIEFK